MHADHPRPEATTETVTVHRHRAEPHPVIAWHAACAVACSRTVPGPTLSTRAWTTPVSRSRDTTTTRATWAADPFVRVEDPGAGPTDGADHTEPASDGRFTVSA